MILTNFKELLSTKKYFLFDLDGTLADLEDLNFTSFRNTIREKIDRELTHEEYLKCFSGVGSKSGFNSYLKSIIYNGDIESFASELQKHYREYKRYQLENNFSNVVHIIDGAGEYLNRLKVEGKKIALGTSNAKEFAMLVLTNSDLLKYFDAIVTVDDVSKTKPDPEIFYTALKLIGGNLKDAVIFEDSPNGVKCAKNTGIDYVVVHSIGKNDVVAQSEKYVIQSYKEL